MAQRDLYIDRLRSVLTALVILHHTAITYGAPGGWFYYEQKPSTHISSLLLTLLTATQQAYFMGFFFLLAGYFTPASLEREGYSRFVGDRLLRLGVPLLAFIFVLGPLTAALAAAGEGHPFGTTLMSLWNRGVIINGPLWFAQALLLFSLAYCAWRAVFGAPLAHAVRAQRPVPAYGAWLLSAAGVALAALAIRQVVPTGENVAGLQLGYFASYIFLFAVGIAAWRWDWLRQLEWHHARAWIVTLAIAWPMLPLGILLARHINGMGNSNFGGGLSWTAILYAAWEPFVAWGLIAAWLLVFRKTMNRESAFWAWLNRRAYAVYIIHPLVLVAVALVFHGWAAPALVKCGVTWLAACAACWLIADQLVRLPGVRRVV